MTPGPDQFIACPRCEAQSYYRTLLSGNTFGLKSYSDGKSVAPMLPSPPAWVECHACHHVFRLAKAKEIGLRSMPGSVVEPGLDRYAPEVVAASIATTLELLDSRTIEPSLELIVQIWHGSNDPERESGKLLSRPERYGEIVEFLLANPGDHPRRSRPLLLGEALRNIGRFDASVEALRGVRDKALKPVAEQIRARAERAAAVVFELEL